MDSSNTQSLHALDDEQLWMLAVLVHSAYGPDLTRTRFNDVMLGLLEQIAGLDNLPANIRHQHLNTLWRRYQSVKQTSTELPDSLAIPTWNAARPSPNFYHSDVANALHCRVMQRFDSEAQIGNL